MVADVRSSALKIIRVPICRIRSRCCLRAASDHAAALHDRRR
jgi:hypothetical protein